MNFNKEVKIGSRELDSYYFFLILIFTLTMSTTWIFTFSQRYFSKNVLIFLAVSCTMSIYLLPFIYNYGMDKQFKSYIFIFLITIISMGYFIIKTIKLMSKIENKNIFWYSLSGIIILIVIAIIFGFFYYERGHFLQENEKYDWNDFCCYQIPFELGIAVVKEQENFKKEEYGNKNGKKSITYSDFSELNKFLDDLKQVYTDQSKINKSVAIFIIGRADENPINVMGRKYNSNYELGKARDEGVKKLILEHKEHNTINQNNISIFSAGSEAFDKNFPIKGEVIVVVKIKPNEINQKKYFGSLHQAFIYSIYAITGNIYDKIEHRYDLVIVIFSIIEFLFGIIIVTCIIGSIIRRHIQ